MSLRDESCLVEDQDPQHEEVPDSVGQDVSHHLKFSLPGLFASGGQSIGVSASALVFPVNIHD